MLCERCFVQYSRDFWLLKNARNTRAYCEFLIVLFQCFSIFFVCVLCVLWKYYCKTLTKHPQNITKHYPQNTTEHHETHLHVLTKQPPQLPTYRPSPGVRCGFFITSLKAYVAASYRAHIDHRESYYTIICILTNNVNF